MAAGLAEAVKAFAEVPVGRGEGEAVWNTHVYLFVKGPIQIGCFDVELAKFKVAEGGKAEHSSDGIPPGDRCECEGKILPWDLREALGDKTGFEARNFAEFVTLYMKYPLALDSFSVRGELVNLLVYSVSRLG